MRENVGLILVFSITFLRSPLIIASSHLSVQFYFCLGIEHFHTKQISLIRFIH